jgi:hypothetical protein
MSGYFHCASFAKCTEPSEPNFSPILDILSIQLQRNIHISTNLPQSHSERNNQPGLPAVYNHKMFSIVDKSTFTQWNNSTAPI